MFHFSTLSTKLRSLSKSTLLILGVAITSLTLAVTSIGIGFGIQNAKAAVITNQAALFNLDGTINRTLATQLLTLTSSLTVSNITTPSPASETYRHAQFPEIYAKNGNAIPNVKLFESTSPGGFSSGAAPSVYTSNLSKLGWKLAYVSLPSSTFDPVLTFWADGVYRKDIVGNFAPNNQNWNGSPLSISMNTDFENLMGEFTNGNVIKNIFAAPAEIPGQWQTKTGSQPDSLSIGGGSSLNVKRNTLTGANQNYKLWIPSQYEAGRRLNASVNDALWTDTNTDLNSFNVNGFINSSEHIFIRSAFEDSTNTPRFSSIKCNDFGWGVVLSDTPAGVRPAIHLKLNALTTALNNTVQFDANGGSGTGLETLNNVGLGTKLTAPVVTKSDHDLVGWYRDAAFTMPWNFVTDTVVDNMTLYACWREHDKFAFTFALDGGVGHAPIIGYAGTEIARPADPTKDGYKFDGWFADAEFTTPFDFNNIVLGSADVTIYAKWKLIAPIIPDRTEQNQKGLGAGAIGGIIAGVLVAVGGAACLTIYLISRRRRLAQ